MNLKNIRIDHCQQCGGTGRIYNNVPGNIVERRPHRSPSDHTFTYPQTCIACHGTGHIIYEVDPQ